MAEDPRLLARRNRECARLIAGGIPREMDLVTVDDFNSWVWTLKNHSNVNLESFMEDIGICVVGDLTNRDTYDSIKLLGVHPDERVCLIDAMAEIDFYTRNPHLLDGERRWYVVGDIDGLRRNERDGRRPTMLNYFDHFYRSLHPRNLPGAIHSELLRSDGAQRLVDVFEMVNTYGGTLVSYSALHSGNLGTGRTHILSGPRAAVLRLGRRLEGRPDHISQSRLHVHPFEDSAPLVDRTVSCMRGFEESFGTDVPTDIAYLNEHHPESIKGNADDSFWCPDDDLLVQKYSGFTYNTAVALGNERIEQCTKEIGRVYSVLLEQTRRASGTLTEFDPLSGAALSWRNFVKNPYKGDPVLLGELIPDEAFQYAASKPFQIACRTGLAARAVLGLAYGGRGSSIDDADIRCARRVLAASRSLIEALGLETSVEPVGAGNIARSMILTGAEVRAAGLEHAAELTNEPSMATLS